MKWYYNMKIRMKLIAGFMLVAIIAGVVGGVGIYNINTIENADSQLYKGNALALQYAGNINGEFTLIRVLIRDLVFKTNVNKETTLNSIKDNFNKIDVNMKNYKKTVVGAAEEKVYSDLEGAISGYSDLIGEIETLAEKNRLKEAASAIYSDTAADTTKKVSELIGNILISEGNNAKQKSDDNSKTANFATFLMIFIIAGAIVISIGSGLVIAQTINNPIKKLVKVAEKLSLGDLGEEIDIDTKDEVGVLATAFGKMIGSMREQANAAEKIATGDLSFNLKEKSENDVLTKNLNLVVRNIKSLVNDANILEAAALEGKLETRVDASKHSGGYRKIIEGVNNTLEAIIVPFNEALVVLGDMAANDYTVEMKGQYAGTLAQFSQKINDVRTRLLSVQDIAIRVSKGDISRLEEFRKIGKRSENDRLLPSFREMMEAIQSLINEVDVLTKAASDGNLNIRGDATKFEGAYKSVIIGFNDTLNSIEKPMNEVISVLGKMSRNDYTVNVMGSYNGMFNTLAEALNEVEDTLNNVLDNINTAAAQVSSASKQVSDSSQALSQGSTEQASAIEELSSSIEEISEQTKLNAVNANQANELADAAKLDAVNGNDQMKKMLNSMQEINESSSKISKIIKVIDEIAFQTNILALNAAVEAARAGQHGKGFAVVAEEVRNLAARSAKAAKETTGLIEGSITKVDEGTRIANNTASALSKIVEGVAKANDLVAHIAIASNEQASAIMQINQGIIQVSQVVQNNSATSQESAAASEELSSQADMLKEMVGKFTLSKGNSSMNDFNDLSPDVIKMLEKMTKKKRNTSSFEELPEPKKSRTKIALSDKEFDKYR